MNPDLPFRFRKRSLLPGRAWIVGIVLLMAAVPIMADVIVLKNGDTINGKFLRFEGDNTVIATDEGRERSLRTADILEVKVAAKKKEERKPEPGPEPPKTPEETEPLLKPSPPIPPASRTDREGGPEKSGRAFPFSAVIPGLPQFRRGDRGRGVGIAAAMTGLALFGATEFRAAETAEARASSNLLYHALLDDSDRAAFDRHQQNQIAAGVVALLLYGYHWFDYFRFATDDAARKPFAPRFELGLVPGGPAASFPGTGASELAGFQLTVFLRF